MKADRIMQVILAPVITEKSTFIAEAGEAPQIALQVAPNATKPEIKTAVEQLFNVEVETVSVLNRKGKLKRTGRSTGRRRAKRIAYVSLKKGQDFDFTEVN